MNLIRKCQAAVRGIKNVFRYDGMITDSQELLERYFPGSCESVSGVEVSPQAALRVATVYACVRVLSESVAQLPLLLYRRTGKGKERASDHPLFRLLHDTPNSWQTSYDFRELLMSALCISGNGYAYKIRVRGEIKELVPLDPGRVEVGQEEDLSLTYKVLMRDNRVREFRQDEIFHLRGLCLDGVMGLSPISYARESIGLSIATERHGSLLFKNGAMPSGFIIHKGGGLSIDGRKKLRQEFREELGGGDKSHSVGLLWEEFDFKKIGMSNEDTQFLETRKFQRNEICAIFGVPPHKVGDLERATFSNIEHQSIEFVTATLMPWLKRWEQAITRDLIPKEEREEYFVEFLVDGLLRGDANSRGQFYSKAVGGPFMTPNEARSLENLAPLARGDELLKPLNMGANEESGHESEGVKP